MKSVSPKQSEIILWLLALSAVPTTQIALHYVKYKLQWAAPSWFDSCALGVALLFSTSWAVWEGATTARRVLLILALILWAVISYLAVSFMPGCIWAPACL